jgi:protein O-mannosyl-transferase
VPPNRDEARTALLFAALGFPLLVWILYAGVVRGPLVYDDLEILSKRLYQIERLPQVLDIALARGVPRKVGRISLALNYLMGGADPTGYHVLNLALHALNGVLLYLFALRLLRLLPPEQAVRKRAVAIAFGGALVWLVHPVQTQAVSYVWQRFTVLSTTFFLGSLLAYLRAREGPARSRGWWLGGAALCGLLAVGTKENAATLPLVVVLVELAFLQPRPLRVTRRTIIAGAAAALAFAAIAAVFLGPRFAHMIAQDSAHRGFTPLERTMTEWRVVLDYVSLLAWPNPSRLRLEYDYPISRGLLSPPTTLASLLVIAALLAFAVVVRRARGLAAFAILWYLGNLVIESSFVPLGLVFEHRLYLPSMMPLLLAAAFVLTLPLPDRRWLALLAVPVAVLCAWTVERNKVWADPIALFEDNAAKAPRLPIVQFNLGRVYFAKGRYEEARAAFARAVSLKPDLEEAQDSLALVYLVGLDRPAEARRILEDVLARDPTNVASHLNLGLTLWRLEDSRGAIREFESALAHSERTSATGTRANIYANLGKAYLCVSDYARARAALEKAVELDPSLSDAQADLAAAREGERAAPPPGHP